MSEPHVRSVSRGPDCSHAKAGGSGPVSLGGTKSMHASILARHDLDGTAVPPSAMHSTPQHTPLRHFTSFDFTWACSGPLPALRNLQNSERKNPAPVALTGGRSGHFGTLWERPAGTQTHSRRTARRLGQLRYARQGLVRDSESNTKYGGNRRKTGGNAAPVMGPSISES